ncbi:MAG: hypothetical protein RJA61_618 [Candidatus Parcubacteria bacterium]|jgi:hypothetical protein
MSHNTTNNTKNFSIYFLKDKGFLKGFWKSSNIIWSVDGKETGRINFHIDTSEPSPHIQLTYKVKNYWENEESWKDIDHKVNLEKIPCYFGGFRWFFSCPRCYKKIAVLYLTNSYFICRKCANLTYESCNENKRYKNGIFAILGKSLRAEEYYEKIKRKFYKGRPTRKYRRYIKMESLSTMSTFELKKINEMLPNKN